MKQSRRYIPYIYTGATTILITALSITGGCAGTGGTKETSSSNPSNERTTADNSQARACKSAIDDVTLYCAGDKASTGKCSDAKEMTRNYCIN